MLKSLFGSAKPSEAAATKAADMGPKSPAANPPAAMHANPAMPPLLNANPGSPTNPASVPTPHFQKITKEELDKLSSEEKDIFNRYSENPENIVLKSSDGNNIIVLANGESALKNQFNNGTFTWMFGWLKNLFGAYDTRKVLNWTKIKIESKSADTSALVIEPINHIVANLKSGDYRTLSIFKKSEGADGKFQKYPDAVAIVDKLGNLPEEVKKHEKLGPILKNAEAVPGFQSTFVIDQIIMNPDSALAKNVDSITEVARDFSEAFFKAHKESGKPATNLLMPLRLKQAENAKSQDLLYTTLPWSHIAQNQEGKWQASPKGAGAQASFMTFVRPGNAAKELSPESSYLIAASQASQGKSFPSSDEELLKLIFETPEKQNVPEIMKYNDAIKPTPVQSAPAANGSLNTTTAA